MKLTYTYIWGIIAILLFFGLFGAVLVWSGLGFGVRAYIEATRYMSIPGKVAYFILTAGLFISLIRFFSVRGAK